MTHLVTLFCVLGCKEHSAPVLPCWYCEGRDGDGQPYDPQVHHGWGCEACDERRAFNETVRCLVESRADHESHMETHEEGGTS